MAKKKLSHLENFKKVCARHLIISDMTYLDVIFGTVFANRLDSKPVWLYLVGAPSSGKTEILQAIQGDNIMQVSRLGQNSLISFYNPQDGKKVENSLLPMLDGKVMIIKDFTAMINERRDVLMNTCGHLRDAYDGVSSRHCGLGFKEFKSKFGIIAAVTNVIDRHRGVLAELGERFLTYRCPDISESEASERCWCVSDRKSAVRKETEIAQAAQLVLRQRMHKVVLSDSFRKRVIETAQFVSRGRCEITRDRNTKEAELPMPEVATRLTRQLCDLATGIAIAKGRRYISKDIEDMVHKTAFDCMTLKRLKLMKTLYDEFPKSVQAKEISDKMRCSETSVTRWLEDLHLLDLVDKFQRPNPKYIHRYQVFWKVRHYSILKRVWPIVF